jgi:putative ABC transport system permease protein
MKWLKTRRKKEADLDAEIRSHLQMAVRDRVERGENPFEAEGAALREFGNMGLIQETTRDMWGWAFMESARQDLHYAIRALRRTPGFTVTAVIVIALGMGPLLALASIIDHVLVRPLPFPDSGRIYMIRLFDKDERAETMQMAEYDAFLRQNRVFADLGGTWGRSVVLTGTGETQQLAAELMSSGMFRVLGVSPILGRTFLPEDDRLGSEPVAVIGEPMWRGMFNADADIVGKPVVLDNVSYRIVGVMPGVFHGPNIRAQDHVLWLPLSQRGPALPSSAFVSMYGRLPKNVDPVVAQAQMAVIAAQLGTRVRMVSLYESSVGDDRPEILMMMAFTVLVLLIGCANTANLMLARSAARSRDLVVRAAIGAAPWRLARQSITEALLLSVVGSGVGLVLATVIFRPLVTAGWSLWQPASQLPDGPLLGIALLGTFATTLLCGLAPAFEVSRVNIAARLTEAIRSSESPRSQRMRSLLMVAEVAVSLVLLSGAATLIQSFMLVRPDHPGFETQNRLIAGISLSATQYRLPEDQSRFARRAMESIASLPGIESVALASTLPLSGSIGTVDVETASNARVRTRFESVSERYLTTMGIRLQNGRNFTAQDGPASEPVAVVNEAFARRFVGSGDPVGQVVKFRLGQKIRECAIVGVVDDIRLNVEPMVHRPMMYLPYDQAPTAFLNIVIATNAPLDTIVSSLRAALRNVDPNQPVRSIRTMDAIISGEVRRVGPRWQLMTAAAVVSLLVAAAGIYSVIAYNVSQRKLEVGIRIALGAAHRDVLNLIFIQCSKLIGIGVVLGAAGGWVLVRLLVKNMYQVFPAGVGTHAAAAVVLAAVGLTACVIPAFRALQIDPATALRSE